MTRYAIQPNSSFIDVRDACTDENNNDESTMLIKSFKTGFVHVSAMVMKCKVLDVHPLMTSIRTLTNVKYFRTISTTKKGESDHLTWAYNLPNTLRLVWQITEARAVLEAEGWDLNKLVKWLVPGPCDPSCACKCDTQAERDTSVLSQSPTSSTCLCGDSFNGSPEPEYTEEELMEKVEESNAMRLFDLIKEIVRGNGGMYMDGRVLHAIKGVMWVNEAGAIGLHLGSFKGLIKSFLQQFESAKKKAKGKKGKGKKGKGEKGKGGGVWTDYTDIKHNMEQTMKDKAIYIARVVLAFNWMCLTHPRKN